MSDFKRTIAQSLAEGQSIPKLLVDPTLRPISRATIYRYANEAQTGISKARLHRIFDELVLPIFTPLESVAETVARKVPCSPDSPQFRAVFHVVADIRLRRHIRRTPAFINSRKTAKGLGPEGKDYALSIIADLRKACCLKDWPGDKEVIPLEHQPNPGLSSS